MSFDLTLQPLGMNLATPVDGSGDSTLEAIVVVGMMIPIDTGQGPMIIPMGQIRFPMGRDLALNFAESLKAEAEKLPKETGIIRAANMSQVEQEAQLERKLRGPEIL